MGHTIPLQCPEQNLVVTPEQEQRFQELAAQWKKETKFLSNITAKSTHLAYQKIIGMGGPPCL